MRDAQLPSQSLAAGRHAASRRVELALNGLARFQGPAADRPNSAACPSVNAIMNYAYAALESELRIKAISEGYDPTIGVMHEDFLLAQHDRRPARLVHGRQMTDEVGPFERHVKKEPQRGDGGVDGRNADLLLGQMHLKTGSTTRHPRRSARHRRRSADVRA